MKKYIYLIVIVLLTIFATQIQAQIKVNADGQVKIFGDRDGDDVNKDLSMQVYGKYGTYLANGRIGIGDYGRESHNGANVFIGELGTNWDSDRLQLHGKKGIYLTYEQGYAHNDIIGKWDINEPDRFKFEVDVYAKGVMLNSDEKFKTNIQPLGNKLSKLKQLNGVSYHLKNEGIPLADNVVASFEEKEKSGQVSIPKRKVRPKKRLGFVAQDVQSLFPELVETDAQGYKYVDYVGLIPVLVESVKEQQQQIDELLKIAARKGFSTSNK